MFSYGSRRKPVELSAYVGGPLALDNPSGIWNVREAIRTANPRNRTVAVWLTDHPYVVIGAVIVIALVLASRFLERGPRG